MTNLIDITTPQDQQEGTFAILKNWLKQPGDAVAQDEPIAELETDKVALEIAAPANGIIQELVRSIDDEIEPGGVIARLTPSGAANGEDIASSVDNVSLAHAQKNGPARENEREKTTPNTSAPMRHSPAVRRLIDQYGLDAMALQGTGKNGRLTKQDVLEHIAAITTKPQSTPPPPSSTPIAADDVTEIPHTPMRKKIAAHMHKSVSVAPHVTALFEMDLTAITADRRQKKVAFEQRGVKLTYTAYFIRACVEALRAAPEVNSRFYDDRIDIYKRFNIGVGTALGDDGLVVPVIHDTQELNLFGIASRLQDLTARAKWKNGLLLKKHPQETQWSLKTWPL